MTRINTNTASLRGLRNLNRANNLLNTSLTRLSTGLKINSGKDNPAGLIASETLRSQITVIEQSIRNSNRANNVIATADSALGEITGLLNQVRGLVQEGINTGALSQAEIEANQSQIDAALSAINKIASNTTFAGDKLIDGSKAFNTSISAANAAKISDLQINEAVFGTSASLGVDTTVVTAAEKGELRYDGGTLTSKTTLEVSGSQGTELLFLGAASDVTNIRDAVNSISDVTGVDASLIDALQLGGGATAASLDHTTVNGTAASRAFQLANTVQGQTSVKASGDDDADTNDASFRVVATSGGNFAGAAGNAITVSFVSSGVGAAPTAALAGNTLTVSLSTTDTDNTAANIKSAIQNATGAVGDFDTVDTIVDTDDHFTNLVGNSEALAGGLDNRTTFTAVQAGTAGNNINISFLQGANGSSTSVAVDDSDPNAINITFTLSAAAGAVTETAAGLANFLTNNTSASAALARTYIGATGNGTTAITTLTGNSLQNGAAAQNVLFESVNTGTAGNNVSIVLQQGANGSSTSVVTDASNPNAVVVTFTLAAAAGAVTETSAGLANFLATDTSTEAIEARTYIQATGNGTSAIANLLGSTALTGGAASSGGIRFTDARTPGSAGTVSVLLADPGANSQSLALSLTSPDAQGNQTLTVSLATDGTGAVTTTADQLVAAIAADANASAVIAANTTQAGILSAATTQALSENANSTLLLQSRNYGSREFAAISVLEGSFATTLSDGTTAAARDAGTDIVARINGQLATGSGLKASIKTARLDASLVVAEASNVANETINVSITGGGSLFQIGQEVTAAGQVGLGIDAVNTARLGGVSGKLFELGSGGGKSLLDVGPNVPASNLESIINESIQRVTELRGRLGSLQKNVIETNVTTLGVALESISDARSEIVDTDFAEETAALTRAQILSQSGLSVLGIANQNPAQVLSLLG